MLKLLLFKEFKEYRANPTVTHGRNDAKLPIIFTAIIAQLLCLRFG